MGIVPKLHHIGNNVYGTTTCLYHDPYKAWAKRASHIMVQASFELPKHLNLPPNFRIAFKPFKTVKKGSARNGEYNFNRNLALIDPRRIFFKDLIETVAHEGVHAEQAHEKRITLTNNANFIFWKGELSEFGYRDYEEYMALPWEIEAHERAPGIAEKIMNALENYK